MERGCLRPAYVPLQRVLRGSGTVSVPKIGADRDLGSGAGSMVETLQVKNGQPAPFLDVF